MSEKKLPRHAKVAIIGGGVVGCSILFHLAKFGWKDVVLLERNELTSGSSWHAAGQIHTISSDPNISRLQGYTINLYREIEETSGHSIGSHPTGGFYLASNEVWHDYLKRERSKARYMGLDQEFISPQEAARRHPLIDPKHYVAALWDPLDGDIDPSGVTYAYAKSARMHGADYFTHTPVTETRQQPDGTWDVVTPKGTINAEILVNAAGLWARSAAFGIDLALVGLMRGALEFVVQPREDFGVMGLLVLVYFAGCHGLWGRTLGKAALELEVVVAGEGGPARGIGLSRALWRWAIQWAPPGVVSSRPRSTNSNVPAERPH